MRKFLSMFAIISLAAPIASNVVACSKVDYRVNNYGNSAYWFLPKLNGAGANADSSDVWSEMDPFATNSGSDRDSVIKNPAAWNVDQRNALGMKILQMLSVALLINAGNPNEGSSNPFKKLSGLTGSADYSQLLKNLQIGWQTLDKSVDQEIANKKQSYKDQYGDNKWQSHWNDMLNDSYDGSEQKYKADLLTSSTTLNASQVLANALLGGTPGFQNIQPTTIQGYAQDFIKNNYSQDWVNNHLLEARAILLGYKPLTDRSSWGQDESNMLTPDDVNSTNLKSVLKSATSALTPMQGVPSASLPKGATSFVRNQDNYQNIPSSSNGILSQFQNYALNKYYQDERPLAVSDYLAPYAATPKGQSADDKGLESGVSDADFDSKGNKVLNNINSVLQNTTNWDTIHQNIIDPDPKTDPVTYEKKMVTMNPDSSITPEMETAVYGSLETLIKGYQDLKSNPSNPEFGNLPIIPINKIKPDAGKTISSQLWNAIQRKNSTGKTLAPTAKVDAQGKIQPGTNDMYAVVDLGPNSTETGANNNRDRLAVAYLDDKGLHLTHVDGLWDAINSAPNSKTPYNPSSTSSYPTSKQNADLDNFNYNINNKIINDTSSLFNVKPTIGDPSSTTFNNSIYNPYLQYLVNQSYISSAQPATAAGDTKYRTQFNIMNDLKAFATLDSSSKVGNGLWYTWVYSFFNNLFKNIDSNWLNDLVNISPDTADHGQWFQNFVNNAEGAVDSSGLQNLYKTILTLNKTVKGKDAAYNPGLFDSSSAEWQNYFSFNFHDENPSNFTKFWTLDNWGEF